MTYDFDTPINRSGTDSGKWSAYPPDVLPMWVADMDFRSPEPVIQALVERAQEGIFGYPTRPVGLVEILQERFQTRHHWQVEADAIHFLPGLVVGMTVVERAIAAPGEGVAMLTPVYHPFLWTTRASGLTVIEATLREIRDGATLRYEVDAAALDAAIKPDTRLLLLSNPHNPVGRVFSRAELEVLAEVAIRHDLIICSDEIHCDLILGDEPHISMATLGPDVANRCVTLLAPSKTFNVPGLGCGIAVVQNPDLMARLRKAAEAIVPFVNIMGTTAAEAAYRDGQPWLDELLPYLRGNRDALVDFVRDHLPGVRTTVPEGTYLAWLDCRDLALPDGMTPYKFFLEHGKVALNDGAPFGTGAEQFVRLNFGCSRTTLMDALERIRAALAQL